MRGILFGLALAFAAAFAVIAPAQAQTTLTLAANPVPIVDATINGHAVRLEVVLFMPAGIILNPTVADRLGVRRVPFVAIRVSADDSSIRGRLARPQISFAGGGTTRAWTGIFPAPVSEHADGVIGPGALPYDDITIRLAPDQPGRDRIFALADADDWRAQSLVGGIDMSVAFNLGIPESVLNRTSAHMLDARGAIPADGELRIRPVILGLTSQMQPVRQTLDVQSLPLGPTLARTEAPLLGATDPEAIVVAARSTHSPPPNVTIGREALVHCTSIRVVRATKQMTLRCES